MSDYSEHYLYIQKLLKFYHKCVLKNKFDKATEIAHLLADETIKLEIQTIKHLKDQWIKQ